MKTESLLKDPVFQLNLLLWMAKEQSQEHFYVRPFFHQKGFGIIYVEHPFSFPPETAKQIEASTLDIGIRPEPELILRRDSDKKALYLEAKSDSFSAESSTSKQARAHLIACGPVFREVLTPLESSLLCYVLPEGRRDLMSRTLGSLAQALTSHDFIPGNSSCHGLAVIERELIYSWDSAFKSYVGVEANSVSILTDVEEDTDPTPLILLFSEDDCSDTDKRDFYRRVLIDQVRARLLCVLHGHDVGSEYRVGAEDLLLKTTDELYKYWGKRKQTGLRRIVTKNLLHRIRDHWEDKLAGITCEEGLLTIRWSTDQEKEKFLDWLQDRRTSFDTSRPKEEDFPLFENLDGKVVE